MDNDRVELQRLDKVIHANIPAGFEIRKESHPFINEIKLEELRCIKQVNLTWAEHSMERLEAVITLSNSEKAMKECSI